MNNDLNRNVLQYSDELQKMTQETEQNLLKIQNDKIKEFKNNVNNISNNCIADIQLLINQTHSKVASNLSRNKIDDGVLDEFKFNVQTILLQAKNDLDTYKNNFDIDISDSINEETMKLKNFITENHGKIESELHDALYQINQSENAALKRLEETYDLGVETIVSAERTALRNLKILSEELSLKLEGKVEEIENVINEKLQNALDDIKELEDKAIANITKLEITIKESLQVEKENIIAEINKIIDDFKFTLQGYVEEMKAELTAHKDKLLEEITINKEEIFIELDRVKNSIIESLREKEYEIIQNLNNKTQELISEIVAVVDGFDLELEKIKEAKIQEFIQAINSIKEQALIEIVDLIDDCLLELKNTTNKYKAELFDSTAQHLLELRNECVALLESFKVQADRKQSEIFEAIDKKANDILHDLLDHAKEETEKYISTLKEQRFTTVLQPNETLIQLPKDFTLNDRVKVYIDGVLHLPDGFFTLDKLNRTITLLKSYSYPTNIFVTADLPDTNLQALKEQLYLDGNRYVAESLLEIKNAVSKQITDIISEGGTQKTEIISTGIQHRESVIQVGKRYLTDLDNLYADKSSLLEKSYTDYLKELTKKYSEYDADLRRKYEEYLNELLKASSDKITEINILSQSKIEEINSLTSRSLTILNQTFTNSNEQLTAKLHEIIQSLENKTQEGIILIDNKISKESEKLTGKVDQACKEIDDHAKQTVIESQDSIRDYAEHTIKPEVKNYGQLKVDEYINTTTKPEIIRHTNEYVNNYLETYAKPNINNFTEEVKNLAKEDINNYKEECKVDMTNKKEELVQDSKNEIKEYIDTFMENTYTTEVMPMQSVIKVPASNFVINKRVKVYFDGILQVLDKHYTVNFLENSIEIIEPFSYKIDALFLQNLPVTNLPKREATDKEIDDLFAEPYRLGTDEDIDGLYKMKAATEKDVDSLFIK